MEIIKRGSIIYYIKDEAIIVGINNFQHVAFTVYALQNRKPFYDFRRAIRQSKENELSRSSELMSLAQKYRLKGVASRKPKESITQIKKDV